VRTRSQNARKRVHEVLIYNDYVYTE